MTIPQLADEDIDLSDYVSVAGTAVATDGSVSSVWRWVSIGLLPAPTYIMGRAVFKRRDVETLIQRRQTGRRRNRARQASASTK